MKAFELTADQTPVHERDSASDIVVPEKKDIGSFSTVELVDELIRRDHVTFSIASAASVSIDQKAYGPCTVLTVNGVIGTPRTLA